jgi:site-specific DNA recombinase
MKAYLIARVSTEDQREALPAQVHRLLDYANRHALPYELIEFQESAYKGNREEFKQVLKKIQSSTEPIAVVFDKIDRYTRDSSAEEVRTLQSLYRSGSIELHFPSDNLVIHQGSPATDIMRLGLGVVLAQYYSDAISDNVKRRLEQKLRDGEWIGMAPIGYTNVTRPDGKKWVEIDTSTAQVVKSAYELYSTGNYSLKLVREKIGDQLGFEVATSQLDLILKNPFYIGQMRIKGKLYPHKYDTLISQSQFDQAQAVRGGYKVQPTRYAGLPYPYRGLINCADCGCRVTFEKKKGTYVYGHCTQWKGKHGAAYVPEREFNEQLLKVFESISIPDEALFQVSEALISKNAVDRNNKYERMHHLNTDIAKYKKRLEKLYEDNLDELITKELYERKTEEFKKKLMNLETQRKNIELDNEQDMTSVNNLLQLSNKAPKLFKMANHEQKRALINLVLSNLQLKGDLLRWNLKKPFDKMAFCAVSGNWLRGLDSNQRPSG